MFVKLVLTTCLVASTYAAWTGPLAGGEPAARYPAGISPQACPNFPHCDNPQVAIQGDTPVQGYQGGYNAPAAPAWNAPAQPSWNAAPQPSWNAPAQPQWNQPQNNYGGYGQNALDAGGYTGDGDYRGEGLAESGAFGDNNGQQAYNAPAPAYNQGYNHQQPSGAGAGAQFPAGVDAHACPNYPFCN